MKRLLVCALWIYPVVQLTIAYRSNLANNHDDFSVFYRSAHCLLSHVCDPYALSSTYPPQSAPPFVLLAIAPITLLNADHGYWLWLLLTACSLVGASIVSRAIAGLAIDRAGETYAEIHRSVLQAEQ